MRFCPPSSSAATPHPPPPPPQCDRSADNASVQKKPRRRVRAAARHVFLLPIAGSCRTRSNRWVTFLMTISPAYLTIRQARTAKYMCLMTALVQASSSRFRRRQHAPSAPPAEASKRPNAGGPIFRLGLVCSSRRDASTRAAWPRANTNGTATMPPETSTPNVEMKAFHAQ